MDVVNILRTAAERLPEAEYSTGLRAILLHIESAIRHYNRDPIKDPDCYTDSIYRTNQAFEGSLKEAYRVLAGKDPSRKTPNEIEEYLETNKVLRPRVLVQLTRYRHDYRNPSTHDYKLDFDANEALIAIVSVAAFGKLLLDQIAEKLAFDQSRSRPQKKIKLSGGLDEIGKGIATYITDLLNHNDDISIPNSEFSASLAGSLVSAGLKVDEDYDSDNMWDLVITAGNRKFACEVRTGDGRQSTSYILPIHYLSGGVKEDRLDGGLIVVRSRARGDYKIIKASTDDESSTDDDGQYYIITRMGTKAIETRLPHWKITE